VVFQSLNLDEIRPAERFDYWQEMVIRGAELERTAVEEYPVFEGRMISLGTPTSELHQGYASPYVTRRQPHHIRKDDSDVTALYLVQEGTITHHQDGDRDVNVSSGDFLFFNMARPSESSLSACALIELDLSAQTLQAELGMIPSPSLVTDALSVSKLAPLLKAQLAHLPHALGAMSEAERVLSLRSTENLAIAILRGMLRNTTALAWFDMESPAQANALFLAACRFIDRELRHPHLDVAMVADALYCSRATLYRAFAENQKSVGTYIRQARLARLWQLLERAPANALIGDLAERCGLYDTPNVNRMFRAEFAVAPSDVRRHIAGRS
jgi:AraC-like DNA-binding protein